MERERKFRFVGKPIHYAGNYEYGVIYKGNIRLPYSTSNVDGLAKDNPEDWEEVTEQEVEASQFELDPPTLSRIPNQDQPASSMTKFEMAVFGNVRTLLGYDPFLSNDTITEKAIELAKETFKQLEKCQE